LGISYNCLNINYLIGERNCELLDRDEKIFNILCMEK